MGRAASFDATIAPPNAKPALVQQDRFIHVALWILLEHDSPLVRPSGASSSVTQLLGCAVPSIYSSARTELAKLLIYGLFRKIRVLAQDWMTRRQ